MHIIFKQQYKIIVKVHRVFPSSYQYFASARRIQFHWIDTGDSGEVVTPFVQAGTYPPRNFATFEPLQLRLPFTVGFYSLLSQILFTLQHWAGVRPYTSYYYLAEPCVFIKQSLPPFLCHQFFKIGHPFPEVTDVICRVPSISLFQALQYTLLTYLCRFQYGIFNIVFS